MRPKAFIVSATMRLQSASCMTSPATSSERAPVAAMSRATASAASLLAL